MFLFQFINLPYISIDFSSLIELGQKPPAYIIGRLFLSGGWVVILAALLWGGWKIYMMKIQQKFGRSIKWVLLAIDVPKETEQSPKAVESIFAHLCGGYRGLVKKELYLEGQTQYFFSLELVSIDGYVQFFIRTPERLRDLAESAIYAQYPDAEIMEVEDYTESIPREWPNEKYDFWGSEYVLSKKWAYPIRTWPQFEHSLSAELKDPLAALLEALSRLRKGEQIWIQFIISPTTDAWKSDAEKVINKLLGRKEVEQKKGLLRKTVEFPVIASVELAHKTLEGLLYPGGEEVRKERDDSHLKMLGMTKGERDIIEGIQMKLTKPGFWTKMRFIYLAEKDVFTKGPRIALFHGAMKQYASQTANSFRPSSPITPKSDYFWQRHEIFKYLSLGFYRPKYTRQKLLMMAYRMRSNWRGMPAYILNLEELATVFHFPVRTVKAPLLKKTEAKKTEPPFTLPIERPTAIRPKGAKKDEGGGTPGNLPTI